MKATFDPTSPSIKAASAHADVWKVYDEMVAAGSLPNRGGRYDAAMTEQASDRVQPGHSVYLFPNATREDAIEIADDITQAFSELQRRGMTTDR